MASEYFSTLSYIWLNIAIFIFSLFLFAVCLYTCLFVRWVYKRRLRQKTDEMIASYKNDEDKRKEMELDMKKQELKQPEKKKTSAQKPRKIHIVTKPCNQVIQKTNNEYIVRQVNEGGSQELIDSPVPSIQKPVLYSPANHQQQQVVPQPQTLQQYPLQQQPQYVLVPVEMLRYTKKQLKTSSSTILPRVSPSPSLLDKPTIKRTMENAATQTSDRLIESPGRSSADWLDGFDERDGERIDLDEEFDENESARYMKRRRDFDSKLKQSPVPDDSLETNVTIDIPPKTDKSSTTPVTTTTTTSTSSTTTPSTVPMPTNSSALNSCDSSSSKQSSPTQETGESNGNSGSTQPKESNSYRSSIAMLGQALSTKSPSKQNAPAGRSSLFPYFVDSKAPSTESSSGKGVSKLGDPYKGSDSSDSLYLHNKSSSLNNSKKAYKQPSQK